MLLIHFDTESVLLWLLSPRHVFNGRHFGDLCQQTRFMVPVESAGADRVLIVPEDSGSHRHRGLCHERENSYGFAHNYEHAGGLRGFSTDRETVYRNCLPLCTMGRKTWRQGDPHGVGWLQGQGAHITWSRQWVDIVLSWSVSDMRSLS